MSNDTEHKFDLALELGKLDDAKKILDEMPKDEYDTTDAQSKWKRLGDLALARCGRVGLCVNAVAKCLLCMVMVRARDTDVWSICRVERLSFMTACTVKSSYLITMDVWNMTERLFSYYRPAIVMAMKPVYAFCAVTVCGCLQEDKRSEASRKLHRHGGNTTAVIAVGAVGYATPGRSRYRRLSALANKNA